jgi:phenylalanyl-tRNA synthetase alpha chain
MVRQMGIPEIIEGLSYNERRLLLALEAAGGKASPADMVAAGKFDLEVEIMGSASWLASKGLAEIKETSEKFYVLADKGIISSGLP